LSITFTKTVCINLDRRPDRWQRIQAELALHGFQSVERFAAIDGNDVEKPAHWTHTAGAYGCLLSHVAVVTEARDSGAANILIFEDDAVLDPEFAEKFARFSQEVPDDWDMLYFGALHKDQPIKVSEHVGRITKANSTFAYAVRNTVFDEFIELNSRAEDVLDGGSLYWVIRGRICLRHRILRLDDVEDGDGKAYCAIVYDPYSRYSARRTAATTSLTCG